MMTPLKRLCDIVKDYFSKGCNPFCASAFPRDRVESTVHSNTRGTIEASIQATPDTVPEQAREWVEQNRRWIFSHYARLSSDYKNRYIAVADRKVIAYGRDPEKVLEEVEKRPDQRGVVFMYMDSKDRIYTQR